MRRLVLLALIASTLAGPAVPAAPRGATDLPFVPGVCTPESATDSVRQPECQRILYKYGPLHVIPGDNLILFGPVSIERPLVDGFVVRFKPDLVRADGSVPPIDVLHLHHAVWLSSAFGDPMFASGEEKTIISIPPGYGIPVKATGETWLLNYMLHNQTPVPDDVFITYQIDFIPATAPGAGAIKPATPYWLDTGGYNGANPIYNTRRGFGALVPGECSFPKEECSDVDPYGATNVRGQGRAGDGVGYTRSIPSGTIVFMAGHLHPGGLRDDVQLRRGGTTIPVMTSHAVYFDPNGPVSWDMSMEVTRPSYRLRISSGDTFVLNSVYETAKASWYEGMGIVIMFLAKGDTSGPDPFVTPVDPSAVSVTHGHMPEADNHGGPDGPALVAGTPVETSHIGIGAFQYGPGNLGTEGIAIPAAKKGQPLQFVNLDAGEQIFHTVTACKSPCNGGTGISYPLANGPKDLDSFELGYGPPGVTAAANKITYDVPTGSLDTGLYTYFCRVHPFMRGAFEIE